MGRYKREVESWLGVPRSTRVMRLPPPVEAAWQQPQLCIQFGEIGIHFFAFWPFWNIKSINYFWCFFEP